MESIIQKAIEGEWIKSPYPFHFKEILGDQSRGHTVVIRFTMDSGLPSDSFYHLEMLLMRPLFWQALGKACGWEQWHCSACKNLFNCTGVIQCDKCNKIGAHYGWQSYALHFHMINLSVHWEEAISWLEELIK